MTLPSTRILIVGPLVVAAALITIAGLRTQGHFQFIDFRAYDQWVRWRSTAAINDPYITIVGITEDDLQDGWPITDRNLAAVLERLLEHEPAAIGVDLYRDMPVPADSSAFDGLNDVITRHPNVLMVAKMGAAGKFEIPPPSCLSDRPDQVGFNDLLIDTGIDNVIRRAILFMDDGSNHYFSLSFQLASRYLALHEIYPRTGDATPSNLRFGNAEIPPVQPDTGAYVRTDAGGYQILMDFRGPVSYPVLTLHDVLNPDVDLSAIRGKAVVIGTVADSLKDHAMTPVKYRHWGVELHAAVANQLIRIALGEDVPMRVWTERAETIWLVLWCLIGAAIGFICRRPWWLLLLLGVTSACLVGATAIAFSLQTWVPVAAPAIALWAAAVAVHVLYSYEKLRAMFRQLRVVNAELEQTNRTLESKVQERTRELDEKNVQLTDLNREKNEFLGMAAHDLRSPLSAIQGFADTIFEDYDDYTKDQIIRFAGIISRSTNRMFAMINNLLDVNAIETGNMNYSMVRIEFRNAVLDVVDRHRPRAEEKDIRLLFDVPEQKIDITADHNALEQILDNLISNALKYSPATSTVTVIVTVSENGAYGRCDICDQGPGLSAEDQDMLFQKFSRLSPKPTGGEQSVGLGLFIVRKLVDSMEGSISCKSAVGSGSTFTVTFPLANR